LTNYTPHDGGGGLRRFQVWGTRDADGKILQDDQTTLRDGHDGSVPSEDFLLHS